MSPNGSPPTERSVPITSETYHITVDGGSDSFFALSIERADSDTAWLMSDTVCSLEAMR